MPKASLIILTYNNLDTTRLCLESIFARTGELDFELILVDNNSTDETPAYLAALAAERGNVKTILNPENRGFAAGNNQGAAAAEGEVLVFLNNDTVVTTGWLAALVKHLEDAEVGMVGPVTNASGNQTRIPVTYENLDELEAFAARYTQAHSGKTFDIPMLPFHCVAIRRAVFEETGPLDERFGRGMFEDDDYALRVKEQGFRIRCAEDVFIHHWGSASFSKLKTAEYWELFKDNLQKFEAKWGIAWQPHQYRQELLAEQLRGLVDGSVWLAEVMSAQQAKAEWLQTELDNIHNSNIWAFAQSLLQLRSRLVPPDSRRDRLFQSLVAFVRRRPAEALDSLRRTLSRRSGPARGPQVSLSSTFPLPPPGPQAGGWPAGRIPQPFVSVILPVHNHADMLQAAAESVLDGTYGHFELIILDDGSTDDIEPVLKHLLTNPRVRVLRQPNQKLPRALTHAHLYARGDFITWTSADNLMAPAALETLAEALLAHPETVLVYADVALIDETGRYLQDGSYRPQNLDPARPEVVRLYRHDLPLGYELDNYINACFLYRKEAAQALEGTYADDLRGYEDYDFWLRLQQCGSFRHVRNPEPLYFYRVHGRTMSQELLTAKRKAHLQRGEALMAYTAERRAYAEKPWTITPDERLLPQHLARLKALAALGPLRIAASGASAAPGEKRLPILPTRSDPEGPVNVRVEPETWALEWKRAQTGTEHRLPVWQGAEIHPLARKAREHRKITGEIPQAGARSVMGCHLGLAATPVDVAATRRIISKSLHTFFVFLDTPGAESAALGEAVTTGLENAAYLGSREIGQPYPVYACCTALWIPPLAGPLPEPAYRTLLALAFSIGRPLLAPRDFHFIPAPYQLFYHPGESFDFITGLDKVTLDADLLDRYLAAWTPAACLGQLTRYANAVGETLAVPRPDFGGDKPPVTFPHPWPGPQTAGDTRLKCALAVNTLDKGGLEALVAHLARRLPDHGVETFVLCLQSGGTTAQQLKADGVPVYIADDQPNLIREILQREKPAVVNTHWTGQPFLETARELGLPVVESIHNTYVWFSPEAWLTEQARSRYFTHAIAVSQTVKDYYTMHNTRFDPAWISVVPNGIDPSRMETQGQDLARQTLGLSEDVLLFVLLASYDGRKNQLATMTAFDTFARSHPKARLWFAGNTVNTQYFEQIQAYRESLASRTQIVLHGYRQDTGQLLSAANAFIINSFFEGWSMAATEALMAGTPLIHSECGSAWELAGRHGERGIVIPNPGADSVDLRWEIVAQTMGQKRQRNTDALSQALTAMAEDRQAWTAKRAAIQAYAREEFGIKNTVQRYNRVFRQIANGIPSRTGSDG